MKEGKKEKTVELENNGMSRLKILNSLLQHLLLEDNVCFSLGTTLLTRGSNGSDPLTSFFS